MTICHITQAEDRRATRIENKDDLHTAAHTLLQNEFIRAMSANHDLGKVLVSTPGFGRPTAPLLEVVASVDDKHLVALLEFVADAAKSGNKSAAAWIQTMAMAHADYHASDLADNWSGE